MLDDSFELTSDREGDGEGRLPQVTPKCQPKAMRINLKGSRNMRMIIVVLLIDVTFCFRLVYYHRIKRNISEKYQILIFLMQLYSRFSGL